MAKTFASLSELTENYGAFVNYGVEIFDSEELTDTLIKTYIALMADGWSCERGATIDHFANLYVAGLWLPCLPRVAFLGQIDSVNDGYPEYAAMPILFKGSEEHSFVSVERVFRLPRDWVSIPGASALYRGTLMFRDRSRDRFAERRGAKEPLKVIVFYLSIIRDKIFPCMFQGMPWLPATLIQAYYCAPLLSIHADMKNYWNVTTKEDVTGGGETPIRLGVAGEMVKSLFYARSLPMTETGRRRPILHWVRAHQRRLKDGIDVDIDKHLRGIDKFTMDGFDFDITRPRKEKSHGDYRG